MSRHDDGAVVSPLPVCNLPALSESTPTRSKVMKAAHFQATRRL
jgi:hypothetical protein